MQTKAEVGRKKTPTSKTPEGQMLLKIKLARIARNLSQDDVAKALGVAQRTWGNWETGTTTLPVDMLLKLPVILQVSVADLLPDSVVTAVDQRRSKDPRLEEIIQAWQDMTDESQRQLFELTRLIADMERARRSMQERTKKPRAESQ